MIHKNPPKPLHIKRHIQGEWGETTKGDPTARWWRPLRDIIMSTYFNFCLAVS